MESVNLFLIKVTEELLYNIVYHADEIDSEIDYRDLSEKFEEKTGHRPMDFFGFGNITGRGWFDFIQGIPGVEGKKKISITRDWDEDSSDEDSEDEDAYKIFNTTCLYENIVHLLGIGEIVVSVSVANYRETLLIKCCEIMKENLADLSNSKDANGNTPLHFVAALPGVNYDCRTLVKYLLEAGVDPLAVNNDGQTFLHIIFGRFKAENDDNGALCFMNERVAKTNWFVEDRVELLDLLSEELPQTHVALLAKAQDKNGCTVLHECALSTTAQEFMTEDKIYQKLLKFGASLRIPNNSGEMPLHYAHNSSVFKIFLRNGAVCRARNDRDETPVLFILKKSIDLAFAQTSAIAELVDQGFVETGSSRSVQKAVELLENLKSIVSENEEARKTVWIPDIEGNVAIEIVLIAIRIGSYNWGLIWGFNISLQSSLVKLLCEMLRTASPSDMKRQNKKGQSFLHVLLDMGDHNKHKIIEEAYICLSVEILLSHDADVNAVDFQEHTPLGITHKHLDKGPSLYKKCAELLIKHGATGQRDTGNNPSSTTFPNQSSPQSSLLRRMSNLRIHNETRKLRSCPKRHLNNAQRLTDPNTQVTVVKNYRYSSQVPIGTGAFSSVFVAIKDENLNSRSGTIECRAYALKRLDKAKINPEEIKREITTLLSISGQCDNIIKCHEAVDDSFFQYLCLDLMDGDLREFVVNDDVNKVLKSNPAICGQVAKEIINGLAFLHEKKFIHRDLKPGNILYTTDPTLHFKITDFGLTKNMSTLSTMTSTRGSGVAMAPGTRCWMAPELVSMKSRPHTEQSDIFSLGLVLHYLLTLGKHPFATGSEEPPHVIERKIADMRISLDRALRPEATSFLQIILTKDPSKRPPATYLNQHPFLWRESKKIEFLKAVGDQPEAVNPGSHVNSALEQRLQTTHTGQSVSIVSWNRAIEELHEEMTKAWKQKKYRTDKVIDLIRFIRNAYAHKQERSFQTQQYLDQNIFLRVYPSLVLDVFGVVQQLGFEEHRSNIRQALSLNP